MKFIKRFFQLFAPLGFFGALLAFFLWLTVVGALIYTWIVGIIVGFHYSIILGIVSIVPVVGFVEGVLHMLHII